MTAMYKEQLIEEFKRQVKLCSGLGKVEQELIVREFWVKENPEKFTKSVMSMCDIKTANGNKKKSKRRK